MIGRNYIAVLIAYVAGMMTMIGYTEHIAIMDVIGFVLVTVAVLITREAKQ